MTSASEYVTVAARSWHQRRPGVHWKVLYEEGDRRTVLVRYEPGAVIPRHRHLGDEQIYVIEGSVSDDTGTCEAGDFARRPPGMKTASAQNEYGIRVASVESTRDLENTSTSVLDCE